MAILPIVTYNDAILRQKTEPVAEYTDEMVTLVKDMFETMYNSDGVGLAAPQIGLSVSVFVIDADHMVEEGEEAFGPLAFINPEIVEKKGKQIPMDEGCLSIPQVNDKVLRPETVVVKFKDQNFQDRNMEFTGWAARVIQHEYDHLRGILFIDYLSTFRKRMHKNDLEEIEKGQRETSYPIKPKGQYPTSKLIMNIVFMGSPDFAIPSLEKLHQSEHTISAVVSNVDKRRGRGKETSPTPVKAKALELGIPVIDVENLRDEGFAEQLSALNPDLFVVVAFRVLPKSVLEIPTIGSVNVHASLLPKYRGAAPIHWAVMNGEEKTGCTIFFLDEQVDTGNILLQRETEIGWEENTGEVYERLMHLGSDVLLQAVELIASGKYELRRQDDSMATPAPKLFNEHSHINFDSGADQVHNKIRGLSPFPVAWATLNGEKVKIYKAISGPHAQINAGEILIKNDKLLVGCADSTVELLELQMPGKKRMLASEFLKGNTLAGFFH